MKNLEMELFYLQGAQGDEQGQGFNPGFQLCELGHV